MTALRGVWGHTGGNLGIPQRDEWLNGRMKQPSLSLTASLPNQHVTFIPVQIVQMTERNHRKRVKLPFRALFKSSNRDSHVITGQEGESSSAVPATSLAALGEGDKLNLSLGSSDVQDTNGKTERATNITETNAAVKPPDTAIAEASPSNQSTLLDANHVSPDDSPAMSLGDKGRTKGRYERAAKRLTETLRRCKGDWQPFELPTIDDIAKGEAISGMQTSIENMLEARDKAMKNADYWSKKRGSMGKIFSKMTPFAQTFLAIAKEGSAIPVLNPYGLLCAGLLLLITVADRELGRREKVDEMLDYISQQLGQLEIVKRLPDTQTPPDAVVNRATDVLSTTLIYLDVHIRREGNRLGIFGNLLRDIVVGEGDCDSAESGLQSAVSEFRSTLAHFTSGVIFETRDLVKEIHNVTVKEHTQSHTTFRDAKFIVPYQRNSHFTGRGSLLDELHTRLHETVPKQWNHRVALYGLGGIGKTQLALEYVHRNREQYERIYWISAASQATLFSGFEGIANETQCIPYETNTSAAEVVKGVLKWLDEQKSWLVVLDNLDDITVVDGYLPNSATQKHTLITTRNPNSEHIPAEGILVGDYDAVDAINLLVTRSRIKHVGASDEERKECLEIVTELGFLPLAIEQAAAYIREATKDLFKFLPIYCENRRKLHSRKSTANRSYYEESLASTWHISFQKIEENSSDAARLLRLLAFLNPDGILLSFLEVGMDGLNAELRSIIANIDTLCESLAELERFSLIRRETDREQGQRILIHRLVQAIIKDEMDPSVYVEIESDVLGLCQTAWPLEWHGWEAHALQQTRIIRTQVILPLLSLRTIVSMDLIRILQTVAESLRVEGNYRQATKLLEMATSVVEQREDTDITTVLLLTSLLVWYYSFSDELKRAVTLQEVMAQRTAQLFGENAPETLSAVTFLSQLYTMGGDHGSARKLQEEVVEARMISQGKGHPGTLNSIYLLAQTLVKLNDPERACELLEEVFKHQVTLYGKNHRDTLGTMESLALLYADRGELDRPRSMQEEVLQARMALHGESDILTLIAMDYLGDTYSLQGQYGHAIELHEKAVDILKRTRGEECIEALSPLISLARNYLCVGRIGESITLFEKAQTIMEMNPLEGGRAKLYETIGSTLEAVKMSQLEEKLGECHPSLHEQK